MRIMGLVLQTFGDITDSRPTPEMSHPAILS
jgi:hypothetical protein